MKKPPTITDVIELVAREYRVTPADIIGRARTRRIVMARHVAAYLARVYLRLSYIAIAEAFGRDRSTVIHSCAVIEEMREPNAFAFEHTMESYANSLGVKAQP
jgi:chromosomal replication initiator protein